MIFIAANDVVSNDALVTPKHATMKTIGTLGAFLVAISTSYLAGFALFNNSLEGFAVNPFVHGTVSILIFLGGLGFIVLKELVKIDILNHKTQKYINVSLKPMMGVTLSKETVCNFNFPKNSLIMQLQTDDVDFDIEKKQDKTI